MKLVQKNWSRKAIVEVSIDLQIDITKDSQDWPFEVAVDSDIQIYLDLYDVASGNEEKKFVLMDMIIEANTNQVSRLLLDKYWIETDKRLRQYYQLHAHQIYSWCGFEELRLADAWDISTKMRLLWGELNQ